MRCEFGSVARRQIPGIVGGLLLIFSAAGALAQNHFWNPLSVDTNWMNPENWDPVGIPAITERALITFNGTYEVVLGESQSIGGLTLGGTAGQQTLRIEEGAELNVAMASSVQGVGVLVLDNAALHGPLENLGTVRLRGGTLSSLLSNAGLIEAVDSNNRVETELANLNSTYGTLRVFADGADAVLTYGNEEIEGPLVSSGRIEVVSSNDRQATLELLGGQVENAPGGVISLSGGMTNVYLDTARLINRGMLSGQGTLTGSFRQTQTASLDLDIAGTTAGEEYDVLDIATTAELDGRLIVDFVDGFEPADTDEFRVIRRNGGSGEFDAVQVSGISGYAFSVEYATDGVILNFRQSGVLQGDYNNNGLVEQGDLDFVLINWGREGRTPLGWTNDLPDGRIDQTELDRVLVNWGNTPADVGLAAGVPEPSTGALLVIAAAGLAFVRRLRRHTPIACPAEG